jgi:muramoyltetrapeptide carboxypeptidase
MKDNEEPFGKSVEEVILDAVRGYDFPVAFGFPAGHDHPNLALMTGGNYHLKINGELSVLKLTP